MLAHATTRRTMLATTAAAAVSAAAPALALAGSPAENPDVALLHAWNEVMELERQRKTKVAAGVAAEAQNAPSAEQVAIESALEGLWQQQDELVNQISDTPAHTLLGVLVKLRTYKLITFDWDNIPIDDKLTCAEEAAISALTALEGLCAEGGARIA